jgi:hypothetical protein
MITIPKVTSNVKVSPASLQTFIDTPNCVLEDRVQYSTVHYFQNHANLAPLYTAPQSTNGV